MHESVFSEFEQNFLQDLKSPLMKARVPLNYERSILVLLLRDQVSRLLFLMESRFDTKPNLGIFLVVQKYLDLVVRIAGGHIGLQNDLLDATNLTCLWRDNLSKVNKKSLSYYLNNKLLAIPSYKGYPVTVASSIDDSFELYCVACCDARKALETLEKESQWLQNRISYLLEVQNTLGNRFLNLLDQEGSFQDLYSPKDSQKIYYVWW